MIRDFKQRGKNMNNNNKTLRDFLGIIESTRKSIEETKEKIDKASSFLEQEIQRVNLNTLYKSLEAYIALYEKHLHD